MKCKICLKPIKHEICLNFICVCDDCVLKELKKN